MKSVERMQIGNYDFNALETFNISEGKDIKEELFRFEMSVQLSREERGRVIKE